MSIPEHPLVSQSLDDIAIHRKSPRYDDSFRQLLVDLINQGHSTPAIASQLHISERTVQRYRRNIQAFGRHDPPPCGLKGRPSKLTIHIQEGIIEFLKDQPQGPYLDEVQLYILDEFGIQCSTSAISYCLKRIGWSRKKAVREHPDRDPVERALFRGRIMTYKASQIVVVDESGCNTRTGDRQWGFSPLGLVYRMTQTRKKSSNYSILPAIGINGFLEYEIILGSFNTERFLNFIRRLILKMTPYPGPRSVLVLDNCATHHDEELRTIAQQYGIRIEYLPPYSPDYSPIELSFSILKAWIKRNRLQLVGEGAVEFVRFLHSAILLSDLKHEARNLFKKCHYTVEDDDVDIDYDLL